MWRKTEKVESEAKAYSHFPVIYCSKCTCHVSDLYVFQLQHGKPAIQYIKNLPVTDCYMQFFYIAIFAKCISTIGKMLNLARDLRWNVTEFKEKQKMEWGYRS